MNKYETVFIIKNDLKEEQKNIVINKITDYLTKNGTITKIEDLGEKQLAYEVKKYKKGFYYIIQFNTIPEVIPELKRIYRNTEEVLKFIVVRRED